MCDAGTVTHNNILLIFCCPQVKPTFVREMQELQSQIKFYIQNEHIKPHSSGLRISCRTKNAIHFYSISGATNAWLGEFLFFLFSVFVYAVVVCKVRQKFIISVDSLFYPILDLLYTINIIYCYSSPKIATKNLRYSYLESLSSLIGFFFDQNP